MTRANDAPPARAGAGAPLALTGRAGQVPAARAPNPSGVRELERILSVEPLTVEGLFHRLLLAEAAGMRERAAERRQHPGVDEPR